MGYSKLPFHEWYINLQSVTLTTCWVSVIQLHVGQSGELGFMEVSGNFHPPSAQEKSGYHGTDTGYGQAACLLMSAHNQELVLYSQIVGCHRKVQGSWDVSLGG